MQVNHKLVRSGRQTVSAANAKNNVHTGKFKHSDCL